MEGIAQAHRPSHFGFVRDQAGDPPMDLPPMTSFSASVAAITFSQV